jgi:predicted Zn-dependent protease
MSNGYRIVPLSDGLLSLQAAINSNVRSFVAVTYWADHLASIGWFILAAAILLLSAMLMIIANSAAGRSRGGVSIFALCIGILCITLAAGVGVADHLSGYRLSNGTIAVDQAIQNGPQQLRAVTEHPDSAHAYYELGVSLYELGRLEPAEKSLVEAALLDPSDLQTFYVLRLLYAVTGMHMTQHDRRFAENVVVDPSDVAAQIDLAIALDQHGHHQPARARLMKTAAEHINSVDIQSRVIRLLFNMGFYDDAISQCAAALKVHPDSDFLLQQLHDMRIARAMPAN